MKKVLVVDDNIDILTVVKLILISNGFEVEIISRWRLMDEKIRNYKPDIILLDIALGDADGRKLCIKLRTDDKTAHIPVILFSANYNLELSFADYMANDFIPKPFETSFLVDKIRMHS